MAHRFLLLSRNFSRSRPFFASLSEPLKEGAAPDHSEAGIRLWKRLFFFVCVPTILVGLTSVMLEEEPKPPEFVPYSHLRIRNSKYPWRDGVKTLFHNPHMNALPDGYEKVH